MMNTTTPTKGASASLDTKKQITVSDTDVTPPSTPTALSTSAHQLLRDIQNIYTALSSLESLAPCHEVNTLLTKLVNISIVPYSPEFVSFFWAIPSVPGLCSQLRPLCSIAEGELEKFWAEQMIQNASSGACNRIEILSSFPYYQNYVDLARLEHATISAFLESPPKHLVFIGSGPLPLTSLCLLDQCASVKILNIDRDVEALRLSKQLCTSLGFDECINFSCEDVTQQSEIDWKAFDVVFLAALVGEDTRSKMKILGDLRRRLRVGALIVVRSAKGMREILYPVLELSNDFGKIGLEILAEVHPWTKVVNSVIVLKAV